MLFIGNKFQMSKHLTFFSQQIDDTLSDTRHNDILYISIC